MSADDQGTFTPDDDEDPKGPAPTIRRLVQQAGHCMTEAIEVIEWNEHPEHAMNDLKHAHGLIGEIIRLMQMRIDENPDAETCDEAEIA